jgi:hypothetical protein
LPEGKHYYKYIIDGANKINEDKPFIMTDMHGVVNFITIKQSFLSEKLGGFQVGTIPPKIPKEYRDVNNEKMVNIGGIHM